MTMEITVPSVGESIKEAVLAEWFKQDGDRVAKDEPVLVIETDKITIEVNAEIDGILKIVTPAGETVPIGTVVGRIESAGKGAAKESPEKKPKEKPEKQPEKEAGKKPKQEATGESSSASESSPPPEPSASLETPILSPSVRQMIEENQIDPDRLTGTGPGGRVTKNDVWLYLEAGEKDSSKKQESNERDAARPKPKVVEKVPAGESEQEGIVRKPMSPIRRRIAERLLEARQNTAMLTTFNDVDMSRILEIRAQYKAKFKEQYGVSLGFMSFFVKAAVEALKEIPAINAMIDGQDIVYHQYYHIGVAVGSARGLVVPVIRHADRLTFAEIEKVIEMFVAKINENKLELSDLEGGTFTITNGGVFGSLLSTPILNTPQSGILGMHRVEKRPVVVDDQVVIRPMMYLAFSYDHRLVDGREAVTFLKRIKECVENPERIMMEI